MTVTQVSVKHSNTDNTCVLGSSVRECRTPNPNTHYESEKAMPTPSGPRVSTPTTRKFIDWLRRHRRLSDSTVRAYGDALERFVAYNGLEPDEWESTARTPHALRGETDDDIDWSAVSVELVEEFAAWSVEGAPPISPSNYRIRVCALRLAFDYLIKREGLDDNPAREVTAPRGSRRNPRPVDDVRWLRIWTSALTPDERLVFGLGYYAGLRRHELAMLRCEHIDAERELIRWFDRKGGKEGGEVYYGHIIDRVTLRGLPVVSPHTDLWRSQMRERARRDGSDRVVGSLDHVTGAVDATPVNRLVAAACSRFGVAPFTPHQLRHSFGTNCHRVGMPLEVIADQMAHADLSTTLRYVQTDGWFREGTAA